MYPPPGLDDPTVTAEHPSSMTLAPWRPIPGRRRTFLRPRRQRRSHSTTANRILNLGRTTCRRIHPEPQPERGHSRSPERYHSGLLVGTSYFLVPDHWRALVSEAVSNTEFCQERRHIPGHDATPTGPAIGPDNRSDATTGVNAFLGRSSDEVQPRNLSPKERADYDAADAAEWKATVDSGSVRLLDLDGSDQTG